MYWNINDNSTNNIDDTIPGSTIPSVVNLNDLNDVLISSPQVGQTLIYDGNQYINSGSINGSLIDIVNLDASNITSGVFDLARLPYLSQIDNAYLPPYIASISNILSTGANQNIQITGENFTPVTQLSIPGAVINSLSIVSPTKIIANITTSGLIGNVNINLSNGTAVNTFWIDGIKSININADPFWGNTILFLKGDGENNSINIIDSSPNPRTIVRVGDTKISTTQSKYGGSSIFFDGSGDLLQINHNDFNFGSNNFTIEFWIYPVNSTYFIGKGDAATASGSMFSFAPGQGASIYYNGGSSASPAISFLLNQWQHIAIVRNGTSYKTYRNGVEIGSATLPAGASLNTVSSPLQFGGYAGSFINAYFDSIRVTNVARYTTNFNHETDTYLN
jgi:hypothetical protein